MSRFTRAGAASMAALFLLAYTEGAPARVVGAFADAWVSGYRGTAANVAGPGTQAAALLRTAHGSAPVAEPPVHDCDRHAGSRSTIAASQTA